MLTVLWARRRGGEPATMLEVVTDAGHQACEYWLQHRRRGLFRREFSPADNRNHDPDQRRDRTSDGPGCGVAHLATTKHSESLERPDQTEQCEHQPERERNDESPSHTGILRAIWSTSCENVDRWTTSHGPDQPFCGRQFIGGTKGAHTGWKYGGGSGPSQISLTGPSLIGTLPRR